MLEENGDFLRPLLSIRKKQLLDHAQDLGLTWRVDHSNADSTYSRNKLRNIILPELGASFPDLVDQITLLTHVFQENQADLEKRMALAIAEFTPEHTIPLDVYTSLDEIEKIELLRQFNIPVGILSELNKLAVSEKGKVLNFSGEIPGRMVRERDGFYVEYESVNEQKQVGTLVIEANAALPEEYTKSAIYLNPNVISGELQLRFWQVGDRMKPIGINGSKLISDILTDAKVPHHLRQAQRVLVDDHRILWCVGHAVSREAIATKGQLCIKVTVND
jgi:tRNA(Ile)-lysidine synthase